MRYFLQTEVLGNILVLARSVNEAVQQQGLSLPAVWAASESQSVVTV